MADLGRMEEKGGEGNDGRSGMGWRGKGMEVVRGKTGGKDRKYVGFG